MFIYCEMHIIGNQTILASFVLIIFVLIIQYIEDTKVPILGWRSYMCPKLVGYKGGLKRVVC